MFCLRDCCLIHGASRRWRARMRRVDGVRASMLELLASAHTASLGELLLGVREVILPQDSRETLRTARATNGDVPWVYHHLCAAESKWVLTTSHHEDAFRGDIAAQRCDRRAEGLQRCRGRSFWHLSHPGLAVRRRERGRRIRDAHFGRGSRDARVRGQRQQQQPPRHRCDGSVPTGT